MHDQREILELFTLMDKMSDKFRDVLLDLEKKVKSEKERRKSDIVQDFEKRTAITAKQYPILGKLSVFNMLMPSFDAAVKGKRSLTEMRKACDELYVKTLESFGDALFLWGENMASIAVFEQEYPSLFPDRESLSAKPEGEVAAVIASRIAQAKLAAKEKAEREERERKAKEEREEAAKEAKEEADRLAREQGEAVAARSITGLTPPPTPPVTGLTPPPSQPVTDFLQPPPFDPPPKFAPPPSFEMPDPIDTIGVSTPTEPIKYRLLITVHNNHLTSVLSTIRADPRVISCVEED
jgi:hypothetical protein